MITTVGKAMGGLRRRGGAPVTTMRRWRYDRALRKAGISEAFISTLTDEQRRRTPTQAWGAPFTWRQERAINKAMKDATVPQWLLDTPIDEWRWRYDRAMRDAGFDAAFVASLTDEKRRAVKPAAWSEPGPVPQWVTDMAASDLADRVHPSTLGAPFSDAEEHSFDEMRARAVVRKWA